jgi:hypothetical protein
MFENVVIFDAKNGTTNDMGRHYGSRLHARTFGVMNKYDLHEAFKFLRSEGVVTSFMTFIAHGEGGSISLGGETLTAASLRNGFIGKGYEDLFVPDSLIAFDGCSIASVKSGCETGECSLTDNGGMFMKTVAETFLFKAGGTVTAWTSLGWGFPLGLGREIHHFSGQHVAAYISKGSKRARLAYASQVKITPNQVWKVFIGDDVYFYRFGNNTVSRFSERRYVANLFPMSPEKREPTEEGKWWLDSDWLQFQWAGYELERWDLPLYDEYQTGIYTGRGASGQELMATLVESSWEGAHPGRTP